MAAEIPKIHAIYRYPVKGLSPEPLARVHLGVGATLPADRLYAIENGPSGSIPPPPVICQAALPDADAQRAAGLAAHALRRCEPCARHRDGRPEVAAATATPAGRGAIEQFFAGFCADELRGPPKVLHAPGFNYRPSPPGAPSTSTRWPPLRPSWAPRSIRCGFAPMST